MAKINTVTKDPFLSRIIDKECYKVEKLDKRSKFQSKSFYYYTFAYDAAKIALCNYHGFTYISNRVILHKKADANIVSLNIKDKKIFLEKKDKEFVQGLKKIANDLSENSRFYKDPLTKKHAKTIYQEWLINSVFNNYVDDYSVGYKDDAIAGIITIKKINHTSYRIDLMGVIKKFQRLGYGSLLVKKMLEKYQNYEVVVGTEMENIKALNFYLKFGFRIVDSELIYHKHT